MTPDYLMRSTFYPSARHGRENAAFCIESPQTQSPTYRLCGNGPVPPRSIAKSGAIAPESGAFASRELHRPHDLVPFNRTPSAPSAPAAIPQDFPLKIRSCEPSPTFFFGVMLI